MILPLLLLLVVLPPDRLADQALVRLEQALLDARTLGRALCVAAHPDDEDGATLAFLRHRLGLRTFCVFANRGEGGQNERGPELGRRLGALREEETRAAARLLGARPFFLGLEDFGYTKTADEAFERWGRERTIERLVFAIRALRPDVVFTNHDPRFGHGQHRAVAIALRRAFDLAGDPNAFPEHAERGVFAWEPSVLLERIGAPGGAPAPPMPTADDSTIVLETGVLDPARGLTCSETAHLALRRHASQGRWERFGDGRRLFRVLARRHEVFLPPDEPLFDPLSLTRSRVFRALAERRPPRELEARLVDPDLLAAPRLAPGLSPPAPDLAEALARHRDRLPRVEPSGPLWRSLAADLEEVRARIDEAIALALAVRYEVAALDRPAVAPRVRFAERLRFPPESGPFEIDGPSGDEEAFRADEGLLERTFEVEVPEGRFTWPLDASPAYDAFEPRRALGVVRRTVRHGPTGVTFTLERPIEAPVRPDAVVDARPECLVLGAANRHPPRLVLLVDVARPLPHGVEAEVRFGRLGTVRVPLPTDRRGTHTIGVEPPDLAAGPPAGSPGFGGAIAIDPADGRVAVRARPRFLVLDARVEPGVRVGVVRSYDGTLVWALRAIGVEASELDPDDLLFGPLDALDLVLVDIRALLVRPELRAARERLLSFVERGGTLAVFYHKTMEWNEEPLSPYPFALSRDRVTREDAPVRLLLPEHPLLAQPNRLGPADFEGWVQERGLYFPARDHDPRLVELLETGDPGEPPLRTGLLAARYGSGRFVYTSLVWYRQWRAGVPGAYRFLANLVSFGRRGAQ